MGFMWVLWLICIDAILLLWCSSCMGAAQLRESNGTDRLALLAFKAHIIQDPFQVLSSWNDSVPYCKWLGVVCSRRHPKRVIALDLQSSGLEGTLAREIGNLSFLQDISLKNNSFHGEIPLEVSFLSRLRYMFLYNNSFEGEIPPNISRCSNLLQLSLSGNNMVGKIPVELGSLSKLKLLSFHDNKLSGEIPPSIGNLSSLDTLSASLNELSGSIPESIGQMKRLIRLALGENKLIGTIPSTLYNVSSLGLLDVLDNELQGSLPPNLGFSLPDLWGLQIAGNHFDGPIPTSISNLSELKQFNAERNNLTGKVGIHFGGMSKLYWLSLAGNHLGSGEANDLSFINTLTNCSNLEGLWLGVNEFGGMLPNSIVNLSIQLTTLSVALNQIYGNIPLEMGNLLSLQRLDLSSNLLRGSIPTSIGKLHMLIELNLYGNRFTGQIPTSLGNLTLLNDLYLDSNSLSAKIPPSLGKCKELLRLGLSANGFNGTIPKELFDLSMLIQLNLSGNYFIGSLPSEVGQLINLEILDVSANMLTGELPATLGACTSLEHLYMEINLFQGSIPSAMSSLRGLQDLDLSQNNFSGGIPKYLASFKFFQDLNLSFNHLEGDVPVEGVFRNASAVSVFGNDRLCGGIPKLHLLPCQTQNPKQHGRPRAFKLILTICGCGVSLCLFFMIFFYIIYWRRKKREESPSIFMGDPHFNVSYAQLHRATNEFSSENLIGVGSFGCVYKGTFNHGETIVAVKVFNVQQRDASKSFIAECEAFRNIRHRNLVKVLTCCSSIDFEGNNFNALVYKYMPGGNLDEWLHSHINGLQDECRHLNLLQRLNIAIDVATALDYLHHHCHMQIIHCDIKPSNILLDDDLTAHLGDLGISRILSTTTCSSQHHPSSTGIKGSIGYIAPEYGATAIVSTHGDVYSYGILLLEMFTGKRPTDEMFTNNFNLHNWAEMTLHDEVMSIIDPLLLPIEEHEEVSGKSVASITKSQGYMKGRTQECLNSIIRIGVACSTESPWDRMHINDVVKELIHTRETYVEVTTERN